MKKSFLQNSIISIVFYVLSSIVAIIYSIFLGRVLGAEGIGKINLITLTLSTCNLFLNFGLGQSLVFFNAKKSQNKVVLNSLVATLAISLFSLILFLLNIKLVTRYLPDFPIHWIYILILIIPLINLKNLAEYYYASAGNFFLNSGLNFIDLLLKLIFSYIFILLFPKLNAFFYSIILVSFLIGFVPWISILRNYNLKELFSHFSFDNILSLFKFGIPSYLSVLVAFLSLRVDQLIIGAFMNNNALGIYVVAVIFAELPFKISNALTKVLFAKISSDVPFSANFTAHTLRVVLLMSLLIIVLLLLFGKYFVAILYGQNFQSVYSVLVYLLPGSYFFNITQILSSDLSGRGYPSLGMKSGLILLFLSISFNLMIIPKFGLLGVAIISSLNYLFSACFMLFYFSKKTNIGYKELFLVKKSDFIFVLNTNEKE